MKRIEYKYIVGVVFVFGLFMDLLDMTITNVALPTLKSDFSTSTTTIEWVVTGYLLSLAIFIPVSADYIDKELQPTRLAELRERYPTLWHISPSFQESTLHGERLQR